MYVVNNEWDHFKGTVLSSEIDQAKSGEIDQAESGLFWKLFIKGRGVDIFS